MKFIVTVRQIVQAEISVEADSARSARRQIEEYGPDLAISDFSNITVSSISKVSSVRSESVGGS
jgi:hypothetical protein